MKYIIARALKENCPPEVRDFWNFNLIPPELWEIYESGELPEEGRTRDFLDTMEETIGSLSFTQPLYFWRWYTTGSR